ncbi:hypothetical protein LTS18_011370, partial [Coniosporium uncinatum]
LEPSVRETFDYDAFLKYQKANLPKYAVPVFLRVVNASTHIHNHKQNKVPLRKEGVDPKMVGTEVPEGEADVFFWNPRGDGYVSFRPEDWEGLLGGKARL